jgi:hypothetical protein
MLGWKPVFYNLGTGIAFIMVIPTPQLRIKIITFTSETIKLRYISG